MGYAKFSDDFKRDAMHQIAVRGFQSAMFHSGWSGAKE